MATPLHRWANIQRLVQCTLECHWNATDWPSVHWDTIGRPSEYLHGILEHHWRQLSWNCPTLECHWRNYCSLHWNTTGWTINTPHTPRHIQLRRIASVPVRNDKIMGNITVAHAPRMPGTFPLPLLFSDPGIYHSTCVTHVKWCMSG